VREEAGVAIGGDGDDGAVDALRELGAVGGDEQREVRELRGFDAGGAEDEDVLERVGEVVLTADDMGDAEVDVVSTGREVVGRGAVAAEEREVFDVFGGFGLVAVDGIVELDVFGGVARDAEADDEFFAGGGAAVAFLGGHFALAGIGAPGTGGVLGVVLFGASGVGRSEVAIGEAFGEDGLGELFVEGEALGLAILLVPVEAEPVEAFEDGVEEASVLRSRSVSSMRRIMVPPFRRA